MKTITIPKQYAHEYVCCIPESLENAIMQSVRKVVSTALLTDDEKEEAIENANNSKVCDLTHDTIKIRFA